MRGELLRHRSFVVYSAGNFISSVGLWIQRIGVGWLSWELTHSPLWVGIISAAQFLPLVIFGPIFGVVADKIERRLYAILINGLSTLNAFVLFLLAAYHYLSIEWLTVLCIIQGIISSAYHPVRLSLVNDIVPRSLLPQAIAVNSVLFNSSRFVGPALGGLAMATYGVASAFALNAISYLAVILSLWAIDMNQSKRAQEPQGFFQELFQGFRYSVTHPTIRHLLLLAGLNSLLARGALELLPVYADAYNRGSVGLAMLLTASGGGALLAGICLSYQRYHRRLLDYSEKCAILCGVMLLLLGTSTVYPMGVISVALLAFVMTLSAVGFQVILQSVVEDGYRGRVVALWSVINIATPALGGAIIGALSQWIPLPNISVVIGLGCTIASWLLVRRSEIVWPETESNKG